MKLVNAALTIWSEFIDALRDPLGAIAGNDLDAFQLFWRQLAVEGFQNGLAVSLRCPDNAVRVVVDDDRDVLVPLLVAGLINAYVYKVIEPAGAFRFDLI